MRYSKNYAFKDISFLQDGDIIDGCNFSQAVLIDVSADLIFENNPNMFNCNLTGNNTGKCSNVKNDCCYWLHPGWNLPEEVANCRHVTETITIETDEGNIVEYVREDTVI